MNQIEDISIWNQVTVTNIDDEDFIFKVNREHYLLKAGETRNFPKFMARVCLKHLVDKILIKRDQEGKLISNQNLRDELASKIIIAETAFQKPIVPSDAEVIEKMNQTSDLDRILSKNKDQLKSEDTQENIIPAPKTDLTTVKTEMPKVAPKTAPIPPKKDEAEKLTETFDQIENEKNKPLPTREKMLDYAKNVLKMDIEEKKTKIAFAEMDDEKLFVELGLDKESDFEL